MNLYYKVLIMMFLAGAGAAVSFIALARELACQVVFNVNAYISIAAAYAGGAIIAFAGKKRINKADTPVLNMVISFSAIAGIFIPLLALFFIRYIKVFLGLQPEQPLTPFVSVALPFAVLIPGAALFFMSLSAAETLIIKEKAGNAGFTGIVTAVSVVTGMLLYLLFLWRYYTNIDVLYMLGILVLASTYILFRDKTLEGRYTMLAVIAAAIVYLGFNVGGFKEKADRASSRAAYKNYTVIAEKEYPTIKFVMAKKGSVIYIFENGFLTYKMPDEKYTAMAALAKGDNILIINGGPAGLIEALVKPGKKMNIVSVEADPYTSYIMEKLFNDKALNGSRVEFRSGDAVKAGFIADTVFINPRQAGGSPYSRKNLERLKKSCMAPGGRLVISAPDGEKEDVMKTAGGIFRSVSGNNGFIAADDSQVKE